MAPMTETAATDFSPDAASGARPAVAKAVPAATPPASVRARRSGVPHGRVTGRTLILMRWIAICGQILTIGTTYLGLGLEMPIAPIMATIGASILVNVVASLQPSSQSRLGDRDAALYLGYDTLQLTLLLYLTGGLTNPFTLLLLAPLTVAATILSPRAVILLTGLDQLCLIAIANWHFPLPYPGPAPDLPPLFQFGIWAGLCMTSVLIAAYVMRVAQESRQIADALAAAQLGLAREQRMSAVGALAAASAHELGTPLATIAVVAKELAKDLPADSPLVEDVELLHSQSERCRDILARLARKPETDGGEPYDRLPLSGLVEAAATPHRTSGIALDIVRQPSAGIHEPMFRRSPEIIHGLGNLLQNALQFARSRVTVTASWTSQTVNLVVQDDGPGFPSQVLARIGEPYISTRPGRGGHMGLGVFIAQTLLERSGATVEFGNNRGGGARVVVTWSRDNLQHSSQGS